MSFRETIKKVKHLLFYRTVVNHKFYENQVQIIKKNFDRQLYLEKSILKIKVESNNKEVTKTTNLLSFKKPVKRVFGDTFKKLIATNIKQLRNSLNMSKETFAKLTDSHKQYIYKLEKGDTNITIEKATKISDALNITLDELISQIDLSKENNTDQSKSA